MAKAKEKGKSGRPSKYESHVKPFFTEIMEWCRTMTEEQIAKKLGVGYSTWMYYKTEFPELVEVLKKGRQDLVVELRSALIKKALGYEYTETKETRQRVDWPDELHALLIDAGFTEEQIERSELVKTETARKHFSPDVAALNLALKNYDKENWANDPQVLAIRREELELQKKKVEQNEW